MTKIHVPDSLAEAIASLNGIDGLLTAKEWERAAIVFAFTAEGGTPGPKVDRGGFTAISCREFAALGIAGLRSDQTVRRHRKAWQDAIDRGKAVAVQPGSEVTLPDLPWGETYVSERSGTGRHKSLEIPVTSDESMTGWFESNPQHAARVAQAALAGMTSQEQADLIDTQLRDAEVMKSARPAIATATSRYDRDVEEDIDRGRRDRVERGERPEIVSENVRILLSNIRDSLLRFSRLDDVSERERALLQRGCERMKGYVDFWAGEEDTIVSDAEIEQFLGSAL